MKQSDARLFVLTLSLSAFACADTGHATVQLSPTTLSLDVIETQADVTPAFAPMAIPAELFEMKILSVYLSEDVDPVSMNNTGRSERIWVNPACPDANSCRDSNVDYFDLTDPTAANRQLNSQGPEIEAGSYHYVRVEFCIGGPQGNTVRYKTAGMPEPTEASYGGCGVTSERLEPAVEVSSGSTVTIALEYDLKSQPLYYAQGGGSCQSIDTPTPCLGGITLTPTIVR
jgi:hypothetical protein